MARVPPAGARIADASTSGVEGNGRLTASTGLVLTVLLLIEGCTVLGRAWLHHADTIIGLALIGPVALKYATTVYGFARYCSGHRPTWNTGATPLLWRVTGPLVILSSLAVLGTGLGLLATHGDSDTWLMLRQGSFIVWLVFTGVHFLGHIHQALVNTARDPAPPPPRRHRSPWAGHAPGSGRHVARAWFRARDRVHAGGLVLAPARPLRPGGRRQALSPHASPAGAPCVVMRARAAVRLRPGTASGEELLG